MDELLTGWGRTAATRASVVAVPVAEPTSPGVGDEPTPFEQAVSEQIRTAGPRGLIARGLGRSYGDAAQNAGGTVLQLPAAGNGGRALGRTSGCIAQADGIGPVDSVTGEVSVAAGVSLDALLRVVVPQGWFVPVTPGTRQVSVGGALAADVHGKNHHHDGSFATSVTRVRLVDGRGDVHRLTPADRAFWAVAGGMGLCGVVTEVRLRLRPVSSAWMTVRTERTTDLDATMAALAEADRSQYSVAWIDCLGPRSTGGNSSTGSCTGGGRGVVTSAEHTAAADVDGRHRHDPLAFRPTARLAAPPGTPNVLSRPAITAFNEAYFRAAPTRPTIGQHPAASFFHPLDAVRGWNRLYGRRGFVQYQLLAPDPETVRAVLAELQRARAASFLAVLKRFGPGNAGPLSFPAAGWTLAVDLPAGLDGLPTVLDRLDDRVAADGGRVYLAKDSRLRPELLGAMYPQLDRWRELRAGLDPQRVFVSDLSRRLAL
ncbi:MAG: FAD-binding oxidoreductase [bacterium]